MRYHIVKKYGGLTEFIKHIGDVPFSKRPSNEQIKQEYLSIRNRIKRIPTLEDITTNSKLSRNCFSAYPFTKLQKECGDSPNIERGISKVELIKAYWELRTKLKHFPSQQDLDKHGIYKTSYYRLRFGSFNNFLKEVNLTKTAVKMQRQYSKSDLITMYAIIENLFKVKEENPNFILNQTVLENLKYTNKGLLIPATISKRFSGWNKFQIKYRTIPEIKQFTDKLKNLLDEFKNREWGLDN
jgi:hypothetical protein